MGLLDFTLPGSDPNAPNKFVMSPDQVARQQALADALTKQGLDYSPIQSGWQGAARLGDALVGALGNYRATQAQNQGRSGATSALAAALGGGASPSQGAPNPMAAALGAGSQGQAGSDPMAAYQASIAKIESGGNYGAMGPLTSSGDQAYGKYQVMGANIPQWTKEALGQSMTPQQFLQSPQDQDAVFNHQFGGYVNKYGPQDAASMWLTGRTLANGGAKAADQNGTTGQAYAQQFTAGLGGQPSPPQVAGLMGAGGAPGAGGEAPPAPAQPADDPQGMAKLAAALQGQQPQGGGLGSLFGVGQANAAPAPQSDPRLDQAAQLSAPMPPASGIGSAAPATPPPRPAGLGAPPAGIAPPQAAMALPPTQGGPQGAPMAPQGAGQAMPGASGGMMHPDMQKLLAVLSNPWATPQQQAVAQQLLTSQLPIPSEFKTVKDATGAEVPMWVNPRSGTVTPINIPGVGASGINGPLVMPPGMGGGAAQGGLPGVPGPGPAGALGSAAPPSPLNDKSIPGAPVAGESQIDALAAANPAYAPYAATAKAVLRGQQPAPVTGQGMKDPKDMAIMKLVYAANPQFDSSIFDQRKKALEGINDGSSPNSTGGMVTNAQTAIRHLSALSQASDELGKYQYGSEAANRGPFGFGNDWAAKTFNSSGAHAQAMAKFQAAKGEFVLEATKFLAGGEGSDSARRSLAEAIDENAPPETRRAAIQTFAGLMKDKLDVLGNRYNKGVGSNSDKYETLDPETQGLFNGIMGKGGAQGGRATAFPAPAVQMLKGDPSPQMRAHFDEIFGPGASNKALAQ